MKPSIYDVWLKSTGEFICRGTLDHIWNKFNLRPEAIARIKAAESSPVDLHFRNDKDSTITLLWVENFTIPVKPRSSISG